MNWLSTAVTTTLRSGTSVLQKFVVFALPIWPASNEPLPPPVLLEPPPVADEPPPVADEPPPVADEPPPVADEPPPWPVPPAVPQNGG
jgi:hypothetical protein